MSIRVTDMTTVFSHTNYKNLHIFTLSKKLYSLNITSTKKASERFYDKEGGSAIQIKVTQYSLKEY
jgi:hypothetical protein